MPFAQLCFCQMGYSFNGFIHSFIFFYSKKKKSVLKTYIATPNQTSNHINQTAGLSRIDRPWQHKYFAGYSVELWYSFELINLKFLFRETDYLLPRLLWLSSLTGCLFHLESLLSEINLKEKRSPFWTEKILWKGAKSSWTARTAVCSGWVLQTHSTKVSAPTEAGSI